MTEFDALREELQRDIIDFIVTLKDEILGKVNNSPSTLIGVKRSGVPNPFSSYMHAKLQQEARERPEYNALSDLPYELVDPAQNNGIKPELIRGRNVLGVEDSYNAATIAFFLRLVEHDPSIILYATAKPPRLITVYEKSTSV